MDDIGVYIGQSTPICIPNALFFNLTIIAGLSTLALRIPRILEKEMRCLVMAPLLALIIWISIPLKNTKRHV
jgi:hypothetical protein